MLKMEYREPWHKYDPQEWPRLIKAILRLNSLRRRKGLPPMDPRPPVQSARLES